MTLDNHYLGCQDELFDGECHMFANKSFTHSGRGNIRLLDNNKILCFYLPYTKPNEKEKEPVVGIKRMPKWFQDIYNRIMEMRIEQGVVDHVKEISRVTPIQQVSTKKKTTSIPAAYEIEKPKKEEETVEQQMDLFSIG
jgi:hypothetical protein